MSIMNRAGGAEQTSVAVCKSWTNQLSSVNQRVNNVSVWELK